MFWHKCTFYAPCLLSIPHDCLWWHILKKNPFQDCSLQFHFTVKTSNDIKSVQNQISLTCCSWHSILFVSLPESCLRLVIGQRFYVDFLRQMANTIQQVMSASFHVPSISSFIIQICYITITVGKRIQIIHHSLLRCSSLYKRGIKGC